MTMPLAGRWRRSLAGFGDRLISGSLQNAVSFGGFAD